MSSQTNNGVGGAVGMDIANNVTTGDVTIGEGQTSGSVYIANNATRTGSVVVGDAGNTGTCSLDFNTIQLNTNKTSGNPTVVMGGVYGKSLTYYDAASENRLNANGTLLMSSTNRLYLRPANNDTLYLHDTATSGTISIGQSASRTGNIIIGDAASSGNIFIDAGTGDLELKSSTGVIRVGQNTTTGSINIGGSAMTSGSVVIGSGGSHTGNIVIGSNLKNSGAIFIDGGSAPINLRAAAGAINLGDNTTTGSVSLGNPSMSGNITIDSGSGAVIVRGASALQADDGISFDSGTNTMSTYTGSNSFTPVITPGTSGSYTHDIQLGRYTQIGERCFFEVHVSWTASVSPVGTVTIATGTLPSTANITNYKVALTVGEMDGVQGGGTDSQLGAHINANSNVINLTFEDIQTAATGSTQLTAGELDTSDGFFTISGSYITA